MPDWPRYLTDDERNQLEAIDRMIKSMQADRRLLMNRAKQRKHRQAN